MSINLKTYLSNLPRRWKQVVLISFDSIVLAGALWASFSMRYGNFDLPTTLGELSLLLSAPATAIPVFIRFGLYRSVIRYLPDRALWAVLQAMAAAAIGWVLLVFLVGLATRYEVPRSVPIIYWILGSVIVAGSRFLAQHLLRAKEQTSVRTPVVVYGAGESGARLVAAMRHQSAHYILAFIDENKALHGRDFAGLRVYSPDSVPWLIENHGVRDVILSGPTFNSERRRTIVAQLTAAGAKVRLMPNITDIVSGRYTVSQTRKIDIDDLLGRSSVAPDVDLLRSMIEGRELMVTGAGGSIGSELCRLIAKYKPRRLVLFDSSEFALYQIHRQLYPTMGDAVVPVLGSITDTRRVDHAVSQNSVRTIFHAAAYKHVPMVEANALEGIFNNVMGTAAVARVAFDRDVENFVLISSDKAVRPPNVMGATKRWAELIVQKMALESMRADAGKRFCAVRFGNVLGSNGSVVPLFQEQIAEGGPLTLTDPEMTRYFMSIHEAAELIVQAGALSAGNDTFLLDMGEPILIKELAENMIRLAGHTVRSLSNPSGDIEIVVTQRRPGEKLHEELFYDQASAAPTHHDKIMRATSGDVVNGDLDNAFMQLEKALADQDEATARKILFDLISD